MKKKVYILLFDKTDNTILVPINSDQNLYCPGCPSFFGGTVDSNASDTEKIKKALERELKEESSNTVLLKQNASFNLLYQNQKEGTHYLFYWTSDFTEDVRAFKGNNEKKDIISISVGHLADRCPKHWALGQHLLFLTGNKHNHQFMHSETLSAFWSFVKYFRKEGLDFYTTGPYDWAPGPMASFW